MFVFLGLSVSSYSQQRPPQTDDDSDEIVRISTKLVQLDAVVIDEKQQVVKGLGPADFVVLQDGKPQKITAVTFIDPSDRTRSSTVSGTKVSNGAVQAPAAGVRNQQGRLITFILDDGNCLASFESLGLMRDEIRKFIDRNMMSNDRIAIYRTRRGASLVQTYTSNKDVLRRQLNRIGLMTDGNCGIAFEPTRDRSPSSTPDAGSQIMNSSIDRARDNQVIGSMGVLNFVIDRLAKGGQRSTLFFVSDGIDARFGTEASNVLRNTVDSAARASVVINTVNSRGQTIPGMITAQDNLRPGEAITVMNRRLNEERDLELGVNYLAYATGGRYVRGRSDLADSINKIVDQTSAYYLISYEPLDQTFKGRSFHKIEITTTDPKHIVEHRRGFYGRNDEKSEIVFKNPDSPLYQAIHSPFNMDGVEILFTALALKDDKQSQFIRTILHIKGSDISFKEEANGERRASFDVVAVVLDDKGKLVHEFNRTHSIRIPQRGEAIVSRNGLDYSTDIPIKKAGLYTIRVAIRDGNSRRLGTAGTFIEIPDPKSDKFTITGLLTSELLPDGKIKPFAGRSVDTALSAVFDTSTPSLRRFRPGSRIPYTFEVNSGRTDPSSGRLQVAQEVRLYRNGVLIKTLTDTPFEILPGSNKNRAIVSGSIRLDPEMSNGEYAMQIILSDGQTGKTAAQSIDFEVFD